MSERQPMLTNESNLPEYQHSVNECCGSEHNACLFCRRDATHWVVCERGTVHCCQVHIEIFRLDDPDGTIDIHGFDTEWGAYNPNPDCGQCDPWRYGSP